MRKIFTLFVLLLCLKNAKAQYVTIPDSNFVIWLQANIPSAMAGNQMDTTDIILTTRQNVSVQLSGISNLTGINYFDSLTYLECYGNPLLFSLPPLPGQLRYLNCSSSSLTSLPTLPNTLTFLKCLDNQLSSLPILPSGLKFLSCGLNQLTNLPTLPNSLTNFDCVGNQLTNLPPLPAGLQYFNCGQNQLTSLPILPNSLITLECSFNQLTSLQPLPNTLNKLICNDNSITCFPAFVFINMHYPYSNFNIKNNPFTCLPNYITVMDSVTLSYPLCDSTNTNNCPISLISGIKNNVITKIILLLSPNPTNGTFTVELNTKEKQSLQVFDISGQMVLSQTIENGKTSIDANYLAAGIYYINVKGSSVINKKLVIVR